MRCSLIFACLLLAFPCWIQGENNDCERCLNLEGSLEVLWWKPCVNDLGIAIVEKRSSFCNEVKSLCLSFEPGVRAAVLVQGACKDFDLLLRYTFVHIEKHEHLCKDQGIIPLFFCQSGQDEERYSLAKGSFDAAYHAWEALFRYPLLSNECYRLNSFFGAAGIIFYQDLAACLLGEYSQLAAAWKSDYCAQGLKLALELRIALSDCLELFIDGGGCLAVGSGSLKHGLIQDLEGIMMGFGVKEKTSCRTSTQYHCALGIAYETSLCNRDARLKLGYEFTEWRNIPTRFKNDATIGFHGVFGGFSLSF